MLNIDDFILILPCDSATDYSLNNRTVTINGLALSTNKNGVSNKAYEWNAVTDNMEFIAAVGNDIAIAANSVGVGFYFNANFVEPADNAVKRIFSQYGSAGSRALAVTLSTLDALNDNCIVRRYSDDGTNIDGDETAIDSVDYSVWNSWVISISNQTSTNSDEVLKNHSEIDSVSGVKLMKEDSTYNFEIGYQSNNPNDSFEGKMSDIYIKEGGISTIESQFISKFEGMKRVA